MAESLAELILTNFVAHRRERAYGQRRGYRMEWFTYGQVAEMALRFVRELEARQIGKGDRVMLWGENSAEWVAAFVGCASRGVVVVPMDDGAAADSAMRVLRQVGAKLLACSAERAREIRGQNGDDTPVWILRELSQTLSAHSSNAPETVTVGLDDPLQIVFTSGATGQPKGVVITHGNVLANISPLEQQIRGYLKYERFVHPVRFLSLLPLSHVFGQFLGMFLPPLLGGTVIFQREFKPSEIVNTIRRERVSVLASVPRVLQSLKQKVERDLDGPGLEGCNDEDRRKLEGFRQRLLAAEGKHFLWRWWTFRAIHREFGWKFWALISGGATLDGETEEFWGRVGYAVIQGYGLTETTSLISVNHPFRLRKGSIGKVLPGREVKLAEDGEILVRGPGVAAGYWQSAAHDNVVDEGGWYRTGDVGAVDEVGNLYFKGRKKDVIVTSGGLNIYPEDLEAALRRQPEVRDCVVVEIERGGNAEPCAVVILREGDNVETAVRRANESLAEYQQMRQWAEWPEADFPRTSTQKPRRKPVQKFAQARILGATASEPAARSSLTELITSVTGRAVKGVAADSNLETDLGLSSLDRVELLGAIEERYQVDLGETHFSTARTVGDLEKILCGQAGRATYHYPRWALRCPVRWIRMTAHYLLMRPAMALLGWPRIEGRENLRGWNGPLLVVSNHIGHVDVGFVQTALPARYRHWLVTAAGGEALEALRTPAPGRAFFGRIYDRVQWILGVSLLNLFPLPREAGFRQSFAYAGEAVDRGYSVLVFPEGRHTVDGNIQPFREGIGLLVSKLGMPVLPMRISGLYEVKLEGRKFAPPGKIRVRIGRPIKFEPEMDAKRITTELHEAVDSL